MIRAVIFDLDGTLVETEELKALSYARAARELRPHHVRKADVVEAFKEVVGRSREEVAQTLLQRFNLEGAARARMAEFGVTDPWEAFAQLRLRYYDAMLADPELIRQNEYPHNIALLHAVRQEGYKTGLASMSYRDQVDRVLRILDITEEFDVIATRDNVARGKPDPEIDDLVARELGVAPEECLVIEDSPVGVQAAQAAGMPVIAVPTPFTRAQFQRVPLLDSRWIVNDPSKLLTAVRALTDALGQLPHGGA